MSPSKPLQVIFPTNSISWLMQWTSLKSFKGSQTHNKQHLASACPVPLAKQSMPGTTVSSQLSLSQAHQSPAQLATTYRSLCTSYKVVPGREQAIADLGLHVPRDPRTITPSDQLQTIPEHYSHHHTANDTSEGHTQEVPEPGYSESCSIRSAPTEKLFQSSHSQSLQSA